MLMYVRSITQSSTFYNQALLWLCAEGMRTAGSMRGVMKLTDQTLSARMLTSTFGQVHRRKQM